MNAKQVEAIISCRVSSKEQEETGYSLDAQEKYLKEDALKKNFLVVKIFRISESASGKQVRAKFQEMLRYATDKKIPVILCEKVDRLTRNPKDASMIDDWLKADPARQIHCVKENILLSSNARAHENFVWDIKVATARLFANNLSEEVRKGQKEKLAQGWLPTKPPLGYQTIGEHGHKIHVPHETKAPIVAKMFELYATGNHTISSLMKEVTKQGLRNATNNPVGKTRMHKLLSEPFYYGDIRWNGNLYKGSHTPIISKELFEAVQQRLARPKSQLQYKKHVSIFKAKMTCGECGGTISWYMKKGHWYGECKHYRPCSQRGTTRQELVEEQLFPLFDKIAPKNARVLNWLERALKESHAVEINLYEAKRKALQEQFERLQGRLERLYVDKLDQEISAEFYERKSKEYTAEKDGVFTQLQNLNESNTQYYEAGFAIHELALKAKDIYSHPNTPIEKKRLLLSHIFSNLTLKDRVITANYTLAFEFLSNWIPKLNSTFEPPESGLTKHKTDSISQVSPMWLQSLRVYRTNGDLPGRTSKHGENERTGIFSRVKWFSNHSNIWPQGNLYASQNS